MKKLRWPKGKQRLVKCAWCGKIATNEDMIRAKFTISDKPGRWHWYCGSTPCASHHENQLGEIENQKNKFQEAKHVINP